jgi:hypothetical protein
MAGQDEDVPVTGEVVEFANAEGLDESDKTTSSLSKDAEESDVMSSSSVTGFFSERWAIMKKVHPLAEISGSFGDLGTLLPLIVALTKKGQINLSSTLLFGGIYGIITGAWYNVPLPIQPMKSISSIALANNFTLAEVMAAGFYVSCVVGFMGLTGLILPISRAVSLPLVRGIQLGTGLVLIVNGVTTLQNSQGWSFANYAWLDNYLISILAFLGIFATYHAPWTFSALAIFVVGIIVALVKVYVLFPSASGYLQIGIHLPSVQLPDFASRNAIIGAALGQIPLTTLNSVIAVSKLADDLFPERASKKKRGVVPLRSIAVSVGLMNIVSCWFGCIPYCHGSGGLAGQYRFGARSGLALMFLGFLKVLVALLFGSSLAVLLGYFPNSLLGVMLCVTGVELGSCARDVHDQDDFVILLVTAGGESGELGELQTNHGELTPMSLCFLALTGFRNDGIALICGLIVSILFFVSAQVKRSGWKELPAAIKEKLKYVVWGNQEAIEQKDVDV